MMSSNWFWVFNCAKDEHCNWRVSGWGMRGHRCDFLMYIYFTISLNAFDLHLNVWPPECVVHDTDPPQFVCISLPMNTARMYYVWSTYLHLQEAWSKKKTNGRCHQMKWTMFISDASGDDTTCTHPWNFNHRKWMLTKKNITRIVNAVQCHS